MDTIQAIMMGIIEGLTEFLPVSSTGHLILTGHLLGFTGSKAKTFEVVIQLGSILAVVVLYWKRFLSLFGLYHEKRDHKGLNLIHVIVACIPAVIMGALLHGAIKTYLFSPYTVVVGLVVGGILLIIADKKTKHTTDAGLDRLSYPQAFGIGLFQCLALWPGFSRSGATISGGVLMGASYKTAAEFSFIIAVPMMIGASGLDIIKSYSILSGSDFPVFLAGFLTAFIVAMLAIVFFLKLLNKLRLIPFAVYRFIIAVLFYLFILR
ncbi:undecaprenyl-diphosphatase [Scopulibacillus daqui]|uniref:Undecaprenyl-diphosphatase n=1 Tax=Scopulibacillus daqui TaxID=1469162 RepID=A0ABS2Q3W1_9BACL|nr:undecaprenyl-diphosphate phosphatase [Scopulibacillus daqui]MBM7646983.1 undecaprenyl-diphosphatase [Scopulibacillus daqui]